MSRPKAGRTKQNAGAFLGPDMLVPMPMHTLDDEYRDEPTEPEDDREPEPEPAGLLSRLVNRLTRRMDSGH
jgi:hypothetical protein